jgi:hypothetical protein
VFCELRLEGFSEEHRFSSSLLGYDASMREKPAGDFYSVDKAAKLLGRTPERVRQPANWRGSRRATILAHCGRSTAPPSRLTETGAEATATRMASKAPRGHPPYPFSYIYRSAWKGSSANFACRGF